MKKMIMLCSLFLFSIIGSFSLGSEFRTADLAKVGIRLSCYSDLRQHRKMFGSIPQEAAIPLILGDVHLLSIFYLSSRNERIISDDSLVKNVTKNHLWYSPTIRDLYTNKSHNMWGGITQPVAFAAADFSIKKGAEALNEFDSVKSITQSIPAQHRKFLYKNGKLVVASAIGQIARTAVEQGSAGMTSDNAKKFGKKVFVHFASEGFEEYAVAPVSDYVSDCLSIEKDSTAKALLHCGVSFAGFLALKAVVGGGE